MGYLIGWLIVKTAREGAQTSIHCAVSENIKGGTGVYVHGLFLYNCYNFYIKKHFHLIVKFC